MEDDFDLDWDADFDLNSKVEAKSIPMNYVHHDHGTFIEDKVDNDGLFGSHDMESSR